MSDFVMKEYILRNPDKCWRSNGCTPLIRAIRNKRLEDVMVLINRGADLNLMDRTAFHLTPLIWAIRSGKKRCS